MDIVLQQKGYFEEFFQELIDRGILTVGADGEISYEMSKQDVQEVLDLFYDLSENLTL